jgi:TRAP-type mannitol/chloroaromatic compound transport system permease large subunit
LISDDRFGAEDDPAPRPARLLMVLARASLRRMAIGRHLLSAAPGLLNFMLGVLGLALLADLRVAPDCAGAYFETIFRSSLSTMSITSMVFVILLGATAFALVFTQMGGGDDGAQLP